MLAPEETVLTLIDNLASLMSQMKYLVLKHLQVVERSIHHSNKLKEGYRKHKLLYINEIRYYATNTSRAYIHFIFDCFPSNQISR